MNQPIDHQNALDRAVQLLSGQNGGSTPDAEGEALQLRGLLAVVRSGLEEGALERPGSPMEWPTVGGRLDGPAREALLGQLRAIAPAARSPLPTPSFAFEAAMQRFEGDLDLLKEVLEAFLHHAPSVVRRIEDAVRASDAAALVDAAHELRGAAANVGAERLRALAARLELGHAGESPQALSVASEALSAELDELRRTLTDLRVLEARS